MLGDNNVAVPTHLYKVISAVDSRGNRHEAAFVVPNGPIPPHKMVKDFQVPLEQVEKDAGLLFFQESRKSAANLCQSISCDDAFMNTQQFNEYNLVRRVGWTKSEEELTALWEKADKEGIKKSRQAFDAYGQKMAYFRKKLKD